MAADMILDGKRVPRCFQLMETWSDGVVENISAIPMALWLERHSAGATPRNIGVTIAGDDDIQCLADLLDHIPFVALHLPKFTDGRVYSHAFRLRRLWNYSGTILMTGDVLRDQLIYMSRCGVNAFYMREGQDVDASLAAFNLFSGYYQYN